MTDEIKKGKIHWKIVGVLFLILIIFPAVSWYYLSQGYNHRKELLEELKEDLGEMHDFKVQTTTGEAFSKSDIEGRTTIVNFMGQNAVMKDSILNRLDKIHEQFDDRNDILFLSFIVNADSTFMFKDDLQRKALTATQPYLDRIGRQNFKIDFRQGETIADNPYLILVDDKGRIRKHYEYNKPIDMARLVEHVTIVMPRLAEKDIILERDKEK